VAIGSAIERGSLIQVFDERGRTLFQKAKGSGSKDGLLGFIASTVTVRFGSIIYNLRRARPDHLRQGRMMGCRCFIRVRCATSGR
jgi:hypothetical protein